MSKCLSAEEVEEIVDRIELLIQELKDLKENIELNGPID